MCGIVGYIGTKKVAPILLSGLSKLEYRGYDSSGIAIYEKDKIIASKTKGRLEILSNSICGGKDFNATLGIGHTRWATHGAPSDINSHPHLSNDKQFAVVHNGIIENYLDLKDELIKKGYRFISETDTEVIAHLLSDCYNNDMLKTISKVIKKLEGSFALGIIYAGQPDAFYAVRKESPLIVGLSDDGNFIASDMPAILEYTKNMYLLENDEIVVLKRDAVQIYNKELQPVQKEVFVVNWDIGSAEKGGYEHFMLKEIFEQPKAINDTIHPRVKNGKIKFENFSLTKQELSKFQKIYIVACGSAFHVGVVAKYLIENAIRIPVEVDVASEFRYRNPILGDDTLVIIISQSGETADTLAALREAKERGARILSIVNVVGSSIARESEDVIYTWAGPEIAVATTKAYSAQLSVIYLLVLYFAEMLGTMSKKEIEIEIKDFSILPQKVEQILDQVELLQNFAKQHHDSSSVFFIGRNLDYAIGLEGSLKLKEISYIHSEAYAAGELKHGTISLIEEGTLVIALLTQEALFDKMISNIKEVKARGAVVLSIAIEGNTQIEKVSDFVFYLPKISEFLAPSLLVVPLQIFAYFVACERGCDVDKPRNLAKSVTVE